MAATKGGGVPINARRFQSCSKTLDEYLRDRFGDTDEAADLLQEISLKVLRSSVEFTNDGDFDLWVRSLTRTAISHHFRDQRRRLAMLARCQSEAINLVAQAPGNPEESFVSRDVLRCALAPIGERLRELFIQRYGLDRSAVELAIQEKQSASAIRMRLMRIKKQIEATLRQ